MSNEGALVQTDHHAYKEHPYRFVVLFITVILNFYMGTFPTAFTPIASVVSKLLNINQETVLLSSAVYLLGNVFFCPIVFYVMQSKGLRNTVLISVALCVIGASARMMNIFAGQLILGMGSSLVTNLQMEFCFEWFSPHNRPLYITVVAIANIFGGGFGNLVPLVFVDDEGTDILELSSQFQSYLFYTFLLFFMMMILCLLFFKDKPPKGFGYLHPPKIEKHSLFFYCKQGFKRPQFINLLILYIIGNANLIVLGSIINDLVIAFNFSSVNGSIAAVVVILSGVASAVIYSLFFIESRFQSGKVTVLLAGAIWSVFGSIVTLKFGIFAGFLAGMSLFGIFSFPILPVSMELLTRNFEDIPPYATNAMLMIGAQFLAFVIQILTTKTGVSQNFSVMICITMWSYFACFFPARKID